MYLKFINSSGHVIRYNEVKKRIILGKVRDYQTFTKKRFTIDVYKHRIDITSDIKLLYDILTTDFKSDICKFETAFNNANFYVSGIQQDSKNLLVLFGSVFLDLETRQFYSISIINSLVLMQNAKPVEPPHFYKTQDTIGTS